MSKWKNTIIGVGGIITADDGIEKIKNGASLIQIYTGLIFKGHDLSMNYVRQLDKVREEKPLLFSYRRCPYAMRARMALLSCGVDFDIFEISLKDKPRKMIEISPKGTVRFFIQGFSSR